MTSLLKEKSGEEAAFVLAPLFVFARQALIEILIKDGNENIEATFAAGQMVFDPPGGVSGGGSGQIGGEIELIGAAGRIAYCHRTFLAFTVRIRGVDLYSRRNQRRMRSVVLATPLTLRPSALILAISRK